MSYELVATVESTDNVSSFESPAFTPQAGDQLIVVAVIPDPATGISISDSQGGVSSSYHGVGPATWFNEAGMDYSWLRARVRGSPLTATATTVTIGTTGGSVGVVFAVFLIHAPVDFTSAVIRQVEWLSNRASGTTPTVTFDAACLSTSIIFACAGCNATASTLGAPSGFTEQFDGGIATPNRSLQVCTRAGFTGTTVTWPTSLPARGGVLVFEIKSDYVYVPPPPEIEIIGINSYEIKVLTGY